MFARSSAAQVLRRLAVTSRTSAAAAASAATKSTTTMTKRCLSMYNTPRSSLLRSSLSTTSTATKALLSRHSLPNGALSSALSPCSTSSSSSNNNNNNNNNVVTFDDDPSSPYAADFTALLQHLQANQGNITDEYWQTHIIGDATAVADTARLRFLARRLRDSIAVPALQRSKALELWETVLKDETLDPVVAAETHTEVAVFLQQHGNAEADLDTAVSHMQRAIGLYQKLVNDDINKQQQALPALAAAYMHVGFLHQQARQWNDALQAFKQGVERQQQVLGHDHAAVADTYQNMGHLHGQLQQFQQAAEQYQKALAIYQSAVTEDEKNNSKPEINIAVAGAHHNLGMALQYQAAQMDASDKVQLAALLEKSMESFQKALQLRHETMGAQHADTAASHMALASFLSQCQQVQAAVEHYQAAADAWTGIIKQEGKDESDTTTTLSPQQVMAARRHLGIVYNNKGSTQQQQAGNAQAALEDYCAAQEALAPLMEQSEQQGVPPSLMLEWVATHNNIGMANLQLDAPEKALEAHQTAQAVLEQSLAQQSSLMPHLQPSLAQTYGSIGKVYQSQHQYEEALNALEQAHQCLEVMYGNQPHPDLAASHNNLGLVFTRLQKYEQALQAYRMAHSLFEQSVGPQHPHCGSCALNIGLTLVQQENLSEAKDAFCQARDIWAASLGPQHEQTQTAQRYAADPASALNV